MIICPHCGKENLPQATRCVYCGYELEDFFKIEGTKNISPLPGSKEELPEILRDLRAEEQQAQKPQEETEPSSRSEEAASSNEAEATPPETNESQVPDWLERIRQRAADEKNATGELARGIDSMEKLRAQDKQSEIDQEFANWIARLRENKQQEAMQSARQKPSEETPEWLQRIRALQPKPEEEETQPVETPASEESAQTQPIPNLETEEGTAAEPENLPSAAGQMEKEAEENPAPEESTQPLPAVEVPPEIASEAAEAPVLESEAAKMLEPVLETLGMSAGEELPASEANFAEENLPPDLLLLRSQKERADLFHQLIEGEGRTFPPSQSHPPTKKGSYHLVVSLFLLLALIVTLIFVPSTPAIEGELPPHAIAMQEALQELQAGDKALLVLDYRAATHGELELMAVSLLQFLAERGVSWQLVATQPNGLWLAQRLTSVAGISQPPQVAYLPGGKLGVLALAIDADPSLTLVQAGLGNLNDYRTIILLEDSASQLQGWMEQASPWIGQGKFLILMSQLDSALVLPYYDSGQVSGFAAGMREGSLLARSLDQQTDGMMNWRVFQVGLLAMVVVIIVGMISKAGSDASARRQEVKKR